MKMGIEPRTEKDGTTVYVVTDPYTGERFVYLTLKEAEYALDECK